MCVLRAVEKAGSRYKTQLCYRFENGACHVGDLCQFAHGDNEREAALESRLPQQRALAAFKEESTPIASTKLTPAPNNLDDDQKSSSFDDLASLDDEEFLPLGGRGIEMDADSPSTDDTNEADTLEDMEYLTPGDILGAANVPKLRTTDQLASSNPSFKATFKKMLLAALEDDTYLSELHANFTHASAV